MKKTMNERLRHLFILYIGAALVMAGSLQGCSEGDAEDDMEHINHAFEPGNKSDYTRVGPFEAAWVFDRKVVDSVELTAVNNFHLSNIPKDWLVSKFWEGKDFAVTGQYSDLGPWTVGYRTLAETDDNMYIDNLRITPRDLSGGEVIDFSKLYALSLRDDRVGESVFTLEEYSCTFMMVYQSFLHVYLNNEETMGVYDKIHDSWTLSFAIDSMAFKTFDPEHVYETERWTRISRTFSPALRLNLVTVKRKLQN